MQWNIADSLPEMGFSFYQYNFPKTGILYFFVKEHDVENFEDDGQFLYYYNGDMSKLRRTEFPEDYIFGLKREHEIKFFEELRLAEVFSGNASLFGQDYYSGIETNKMTLFQLEQDLDNYQFNSKFNFNLLNFIAEINFDASRKMIYNFRVDKKTMMELDKNQEIWKSITPLVAFAFRSRFSLAWLF